MINLVIISPMPALRAGLRALIAADPDFVVTATGSSLESVALPPETHVLVMTREAALMAGEGGAALASAVPVLMIVDGEVELRELAGLGVGQTEGRPWGLISADAPAEALQAAVRGLAEGLVVASPDLIQALLGPALSEARAGELDEDMAGGEHLTEREIDVLREVARGLTNKQIALALGISEHTVKFHVSSVYAKLGASNRTEAVRKGARRGLIPL